MNPPRISPATINSFKIALFPGIIEQSVHIQMTEQGNEHQAQLFYKD
jgi:hypothetical protein